eukprot:1923923-Alexandrium_andersonii.AAC.1
MIGGVARVAPSDLRRLRPVRTNYRMGSGECACFACRSIDPDVVACSSSQFPDSSVGRNSSFEHVDSRGGVVEQEASTTFILSS